MFCALCERTAVRYLFTPCVHGRILHAHFFTQTIMGYQAFDRHAGFCKLCWKWTEDRMTAPVFEKCVRGKNRKHGRVFNPINRPIASEKTLAAAHGHLQEINATSNASNENPFLFGELLYLYARGHDYRVLREHGLESDDTQEMLLDKIEQNLIENEWFSQIMRSHPIQFGIKCFKPRIGDKKSAPVRPSSVFCPDHNPHRSIESRRRYQNDRKRITDFETEIDRLYRHYINLCIGIHSDNDRQILRREAYLNVFSSTLEKIKELQADGKKQKEIADILKVSKQVVSNALRREKK